MIKTCKRGLHQYDTLIDKRGCVPCAKVTNRKWVDNHPESKRKSSYKYFLNNRKKRLAYGRSYAEKNPYKHRIYAEKNRKKINFYFSNRRQEDIEFKLTCNLRSRLHKVIKGTVKNGLAVRDLGCSAQFLKTHIESQFQKDMTWDNYGKGPNRWSIDHIIALSTVDLTNKEQFLLVCHYTNLRPLWNVDQIKLYYSEQRYFKLNT
jgi:hypothetical protein